MFRSSKKKKLHASKRRRIVRSSFDDDENDDETDGNDREQLDPMPGETTGDGGIDTAETNATNTNAKNTPRTKPGADDNEEDEEPPPPSALLLLRQRKTASKASSSLRTTKRGKRKLGGSGGLVVRSFDVEEADDEDGDDNDNDEHDNDDNDDDRGARNHKDRDKRKRKHKDKHKKKHKRKRNGLGFGGGVTSTELGDDENEDENENNNENNDMNRVGSAPTQTYGREALEQLRAEQNRTKPLRASGGNNDNENGNENGNGNGNENGNPPAKEDGDENEEESFIPLNGDPPGDAPPSNAPASNESIFAVDPPPEEPSGWEQRIEQRAGIRTATAATATHSHSPPHSQPLSLPDLSARLRSAAEALVARSTDLSRAANRKRADRDRTVAESLTHESEHLAAAGTACEFYQTVRRDLALRAGALRDLRRKLEPVEAAFAEMLTAQLGEEGTDLRSWQDDCCAVLRETHRLESIAGRQPSSSLSSSSAVVCDEFGRDVRSQYLRDREARFKDRLARMGDGCDDNGNDNGNDKNNDDKDAAAVSRIPVARVDRDEARRSETLLRALEVAIDDLDEAYTSETRFRSVFDRWFAAYPEDYHQCYATLSFGDLYAVLVRTEVCRSGFFSDLLVSPSSSSSSGTAAATTGEEPKGSAPSSVRGLLERCLVAVSPPGDSTGNNRDAGETEPPDESARKENEGRWVRSVEKGLLPMLTEILGEGGGTTANSNTNTIVGETNATATALKSKSSGGDCLGLFYSSRKSSLLSKLVAEALRHPSGGPSDGAFGAAATGATAAATTAAIAIATSHSSTRLRQSLEKSISSSIRRTLDGIAIPILRVSGKDNGESNREGDAPTNKESSPSPTPSLLSASSGAESCSVRYALTYQAEILRQTLCNIIVHWLPLISLEDNVNSNDNSSNDDDRSPNGIHAVLDFVNEKYLLLLSSLENAREHQAPGALGSPSAESLFAPVWEALQKDPRRILDAPSLMLATMPLRAAARAYSLR